MTVRNDDVYNSSHVAVPYARFVALASKQNGGCHTFCHSTSNSKVMYRCFIPYDTAVQERASSLTTSALACLYLHSIEVFRSLLQQRPSESLRLSWAPRLRKVKVWRQLLPAPGPWWADGHTSFHLPVQTVLASGKRLQRPAPEGILHLSGSTAALTSTTPTTAAAATPTAAADTTAAATPGRTGASRRHRRRPAAPSNRAPCRRCCYRGRTLNDRATTTSSNGFAAFARAACCRR